MLNHNKSMLRVLLLVLSVLMVVSLAACGNKDSGDDEMNAVLSQAIADQQKALESQKKAQEDAIAAQQELKDALAKAEADVAAAQAAADKAAKDAAAQADAAKAAKDAADAAKAAADKATADAKAAADKAAKDAKAAADKAAADAKAAKDAADKAKAEADKAVADAAKAIADAQAAAAAAQESLKAIEESIKAAEESKLAAEESKLAAEESKLAEAESSRLAAEESKAAEESSRKEAEESSRKEYEESLAASISNALTTTEPAPTESTPTESASATTQKPATETEAIKLVVEDFSKLKRLYTITNIDMYVGNNIDEVFMLFEKASVDLNYATTGDQARDIYNQLKTDVEAVESVASRAAALNDMITNLGDVEAQVITTAATKLTAVTKAWYSMFETYTRYLAGVNYNDNWTEKQYNDYAAIAAETAADELGVAMGDYNKAVNKMAVLKAYAQSSLNKALDAVWTNNNKTLAFNEYMLTETNTALIADAYYKYQILSIVNGGDTAVADLEIAWENTLNDDGSVKYDDKGYVIPNYDKPIDYFTVEEFLNTFAYVYLNAEFRAAANDAANWLRSNLNEALYNKFSADVAAEIDVTIAPVGQVLAAFNTKIGALTSEVSALNFKDNYKTTATLDKAIADVRKMAVVAYVDAFGAITELSKNYAISAYQNKIDAELVTLNKQLDDAQSAETLDYDVINTIKGNISTTEKNLAKFKANVADAPVYTYAALNAADARIEVVGKTETVKLAKAIEKYIKATNGAMYVEAAAMDYIYDEILASVTENFVTEIETYDNQVDLIVTLLVADLEALIERLDPANGSSADLYWNNKGSKIAYDTSNKYEEGVYSNTVKFEGHVTTLTTAIQDLESILTGYNTAGDGKYDADTQRQVKTPDSDYAGSSHKKAALYFINADAQKFIVDTYGLETPEYWAALYADGDKLTNSKASADFLTYTKKDGTTVALTYTYKAAEAACYDAYTAYNTAFTAIHTAIQGYNGNITNTQNLITNDAAYKAILARVGESSAIGNEIKEFAALYTGYMSSDAKLSNAFETAKWLTSVSRTDYINKTGKWVTIKSDVVENAKNYDEDGILNNITPHVATFESKFYTDATKTETNVVVLYSYKQVAKNAITALIKNYKNTYVINANGVSTQVPATAGYQYDAGLTEVSEAGVQYELALDAALAAAITSIDGVKLNARADVTNYLADDHNNDGVKGDNKILAKCADKAWTIDTAKATVNAYVVRLLGYDAAKAMSVDYTVGVTDKYADTTWTLYANADSAAFNAYKTAYLVDYSAVILPMN